MNIYAPFAGIVRYHVTEGQTVSTGEVLATVETVKLEAPVMAPGPGVVTVVPRDDFSDVLGGDVLLEVSS